MQAIPHDSCICLLPQGGSVEALEALAEAGAETGATCRLSGCGGVDCLMLACRYGMQNQEWGWTNKTSSVIILCRTSEINLHKK